MRQDRGEVVKPLTSAGRPASPLKPDQRRRDRGITPEVLVHGVWDSQVTSIPPQMMTMCACNGGWGDQGVLGKERAGCGRMLLGCAAAAGRGAPLSCSYTQELPRDKQPQLQELPGWECKRCSFGMATPWLLSSSWTRRFTGVWLCTHIHVWTHSPVPGILQAKQMCQRDGERKYSPQELNSKRNSKCKTARGTF